jgi:hypothetical protein
MVGAFRFYFISLFDWSIFHISFDISHMIAAIC